MARPGVLAQPWSRALLGALGGAVLGVAIGVLVEGSIHRVSVIIAAAAASITALIALLYERKSRTHAPPTDPRLAALKLPTTPEGVLGLLSEMPAPFILLDRDLRHIAVTERHLKQHGLPPREQFLWRQHYEIFNPISEQWKEMHRRTLAGETFSTTQEWWIRPDGRGEWILWEIKPWHNAEGAIGGIAIYGEVISEIVEAETKARTAIEHLRNFYELVPHGLWSAGPNGDILDASPAFLERLGMRLDELKSQWPSGPTLIHPDDRGALRDAWNRSITSGRPCDVELRFRVADATYRWFRTRALPQLGEQGAVVRWIGIFEDVHDKKLAELELRDTEERLRQSQKMEAIGQLTGGVAHDFNNLLAVLAGNLELLEQELADSPELREFATTGLRAVERGATLTRSLLAFSRQQPLSPQAVDLRKLVQEILELVRRTVPENIDLEFVSAAGQWKCEADPGQLQNALLNLVANARDAMPEGGRLTIETGNARLDDNYAALHSDVKPGQYVMLAVSDTGAGMGADVIAKAFTPFFTTKPLGKGSGLGLSMVYGFVRQSHGHVKIYSELGHGTTVRIYLPRAFGPAIEPAPAEIARRASRGGEQILVVEDDPDVRALARTLLRSLGYDVVEAATPREALQAVQRHPGLALMLVDVVLPGGMNGPQLMAEIARTRGDIKVLYMSGYTENAIFHHGRLDPGVHLLQKPFTKSELASKVAALLDGR